MHSVIHSKLDGHMGEGKLVQEDWDAEILQDVWSAADEGQFGGRLRTWNPSQNEAFV